MDGEKSGGSNNNYTGKTMSQAEAEALRKCLEENKGESQANCKSKLEAYYSSSHPKKRLAPLRRTRGSLTDV